MSMLVPVGAVGACCRSHGIICMCEMQLWQEQDLVLVCIRAETCVPTAWVVLGLHLGVSSRAVRSESMRVPWRVSTEQTSPSVE